MVTICIAALKGGVGKTTTATTLAYLLAKEHEKRVLLVDADCQGNASSVYGIFDSEEKGMAEIMSWPLDHYGEMANIKQYIHNTEYEVDVITANGYLMQTNGRLMAEQEFNQVSILRNALQDVENDYDFCIIDCGLQLDMTVVNAITAADYLLSPVKIGGFELNAAEELENQAYDLGAINPDLTIFSVITMFQNNKSSRIYEENLKERYLSNAFENHVRNSMVVTKKSFENGPLPCSSNCITVKDYREVTNELLEMIGV